MASDLWSWDGQEEQHEEKTTVMVLQRGWKRNNYSHKQNCTIFTTKIKIPDDDLCRILNNGTTHNLNKNTGYFSDSRIKNIFKVYQWIKVCNFGKGFAQFKKKKGTFLWKKGQIKTFFKIYHSIKACNFGHGSLNA